jgi:hypothetical protein
MIRAFALVVAILCPGLALAQGSPGAIPGQILTDGTGRLTNTTAAEINQWFAAKQNYSPSLFSLGNLNGGAGNFPYFTGPGAMGLGTFGSGLQFNNGVLSVTGFPGGIVSPALGGTGVNNGTSTISLGGPLTTTNPMDFGQLTTPGQLLYVASPGDINGLATCDLGGIFTNGSGTPACSQVLPAPVQSSITQGHGGAFGTAAYTNTGTSGATVPLLNGNNFHTGQNVFGGTGFTATPQILPGSVVIGSGEPWADVMAFGAASDNATNNAAAFQNAVNAVEANVYSGVVRVPSGWGGTYCMWPPPGWPTPTVVVTLHNAGVTIEGESLRTSTIGDCGHTGITLIEGTNEYQAVRTLVLYGPGTSGEPGNTETETAASSFNTSSTTITMAANNPGCTATPANCAVVTGDTVYDLSTGLTVGTVSTWPTGSTTLTLEAAAANASSGAADSLMFWHQFSGVPTIEGSSGCGGCVFENLIVNGGGGFFSAGGSILMRDVVVLSSYGDLIHLTGSAWIDHSAADLSPPANTGPAAWSLGSVPNWTTNEAYAVGDFARVGNSILQVVGCTASCFSGLTSAGMPPAPPYGVNVTDRQVTWQNMTYYASISLYLDGTTEIYIDQFDATSVTNQGIVKTNGYFKCHQCLQSGSIIDGITFSGGNEPDQFTALTQGGQFLQNSAGVKMAGDSGDLEISASQIQGDFGMIITGGTGAVVGSQIITNNNPPIDMINGTNAWRFIGNSIIDAPSPATPTNTVCAQLGNASGNADYVTMVGNFCDGKGISLTYVGSHSYIPSGGNP